MRSALLLFVAACGRFGFDGTGDASSVRIDALAPDGVVTAECTATRVADVMLTAPVTDVIAAKTPGGYSVGFLSGASSILAGVFVSDALTPNTDTPFQTSPAMGSSLTYNRASMFWTGTLLVGAASVAEDGTCYKKIFPTDMTQYQYADAGLQCRHGEPSVAMAGQTALTTWFDSGEHFFTTLDVDGIPQEPKVSAGVLGGAIDDTSVASGITAVIATSAVGRCEARQIPSIHGQELTTDACRKPHIVNAGEIDTWIVAYENGANVSVRALAYVGAGQDLTITPGLDLGLGEAPRLFRSANGWLVATARAGLAIHDLDPASAVPISGLPTGFVDAFDVAGDTVFAAYGPDLYAVRCE